MQPIGKYEVIAEIGSGSMGTIYQARDSVLDRLVALKVLSTEAGLDPELKERFYREARAGAKLTHPNIVTIFDLGESGDALFIAMELLSGADLRRLLKEGRLPSVAVKLDMMAQVCNALDHAHSQQLVHRDIKPSNIFLCDDQRAKVLDFGIAKLPTSNLTVAGKVLGSPNYMAPEQIRSGKCDSRSDLFSAAIVFYEFLTGAHPFQDDFIPRRIVSDQPDSLRQKNQQLPEALESLLGRVFEKDPEKRIQTAAEFASGLRSILATIGSSPITAPVEPLQPSTAQHLAPPPAPFITATPPHGFPAPAPTAPQAIPAAQTPPQGVPVPVATPPQGISTSTSLPASANSPTNAFSPAASDTAEQRVSEFLRVVGDFDEGIDKRDTFAARTALDQMRRLAAIDSRFVVAVSDCESRLNEITLSRSSPVTPPPSAAPTAPAPATIQSTKPLGPHPVALAPPRPVSPPPAARAGMNKLALGGIAAVLVLLIAGAIFLQLRKPAPVASAPPVTVAPLAPVVATAVVEPGVSDLLSAAQASSRRLAILHHGETVNVIALPTARDQEFTNVRTIDNPTPGYVRTAELSEWAGATADSAFALATLFGSGESGSESELNAKLEQWNQFIGRFPASPHVPEANLGAARIEYALAKSLRTAGKPASEWQPHLERARQALASITAMPALDNEVAELRRQLGETGLRPATGSIDENWRAKVASFWESGQYQDAMAAVNRVLAVAPGNQEALSWKNKIRASQEAEANAK